MGFIALNVNVISADDLKNVNRFTKMDVYTVVSISGDPQKQMFKTPVNHNAGSNPTWNFSIKFAVDDSLAHQNPLSLDFKIKSKRILGDKDIGEVNVPVMELIDGKLPQSLDYQVRTPTGKLKGLLHFSYNFGDVVPAASGTPYAPPMQNGGYPYPSPLQGYGYPPPQQHPGYGAYPAQGGYGYPPVQQQQQQAPKNKLGIGWEAGLIGGKLGVLWVGDMVPDLAGMDMGGFDF
ncbi:hypothetical protein Q3G72_023937 [Acer saccharum]|nr:hypothetical protein Q3G72_023937 [Acer saccharum]